MRDRRRYLHWLFEAKKRFGLSVLNYMITSNHVHLLIKDTGPNVIADSMQLIAGRTAQEYNQRKDRQGAFWEDRYHATAIEADEHLHRCLVDLLRGCTICRIATRRLFSRYESEKSMSMGI
jgi:REP element-mobilizing transposase RayT